MKTFSKLAVLFPPLAAACGGASHSDFRAAPAQEVECSLSINAESSAEEVQKTIDAVLNGDIDACNGAVADLRSMSVSFARTEVDTDARELRLIFRYSSNPDVRPPHYTP